MMKKRLLYDNMILKESQITGVMVQYYKACKRELWFYLNQINMNYDNDDIEIGKLIHENSYKREKKEIRLENMVFDFVKNKDEIEVYEINKSSKLTIGVSYQLYFYICTLKKSNINAKGYLVYPKEKKKDEVTLTDELINELKEIMKDIIKISDLQRPPEAINKPYCRRCTYYELCMI